MADPFIGHTVLKKFPGFGKEPWEGRVEKVVAPGKYLVFFKRDSSELTMTSKALMALGLGSPAPAAAGVGKRRRAATSTSAAAPAGKKGKAKVKAKAVAKAKVEVKAKAKAKAKPVKGKAKARKRADMAPAAAAATTSGAVAADAIAIDLADDADAEENASTTGKRARRAVGKAEGGASSRKGVGSSTRKAGAAPSISCHVCPKTWASWAASCEGLARPCTCVAERMLLKDKNCSAYGKRDGAFHFNKGRGPLK